MSWEAKNTKETQLEVCEATNKEFWELLSTTPKKDLVKLSFMDLWGQTEKRAKEDL